MTVIPATLILIPTHGERQVLRSRLSPLLDSEVRIQLCGFGPVASAARTSQLIASLQPRRIILVGIAGALSSELRIGSARVFEDVALYGIGAGSGDTFRNAGELGWSHWTETPDGQETVHVRDTISLHQSDEAPEQITQLLTVCSAAASQKDVRDRLQKFPHAVAEDMEGFSVALSGALAGVPVTIVRGISNIAGDRDHSRWRITDALHAAADLVLEILS